jgi:DNA-binding protein
MEAKEKEVPSIFIGKKPLSRYLASCFTIVNKNNVRIWVEGMGQNIGKTVDVAN